MDTAADDDDGDVADNDENDDDVQRPSFQSSGRLPRRPTTTSSVSNQTSGRTAFCCMRLSPTDARRTLVRLSLHYEHIHTAAN